jgi:hypothetical protein
VRTCCHRAAPFITDLLEGGLSSTQLEQQRYATRSNILPCNRTPAGFHDTLLPNTRTRRARIWYHSAPCPGQTKLSFHLSLHGFVHTSSDHLGNFSIRVSWERSDRNHRCHPSQGKLLLLLVLFIIITSFLPASGRGQSLYLTRLLPHASRTRTRP